MRVPVRSIALVSVVLLSNHRSRVAMSVGPFGVGHGRTKRRRLWAKRPSTSTQAKDRSIRQRARRSMKPRPMRGRSLLRPEAPTATCSMPSLTLALQARAMAPHLGALRLALVPRRHKPQETVPKIRSMRTPPIPEQHCPREDPSIKGAVSVRARQGYSAADRYGPAMPRSPFSYEWPSRFNRVVGNAAGASARSQCAMVPREPSPRRRALLSEVVVTSLRAVRTDLLRS